MRSAYDARLSRSTSLVNSLPVPSRRPSASDTRCGIRRWADATTPIERGTTTRGFGLAITPATAWATSCGSAFLKPLACPTPAIISVFVRVGMIAEKRMPRPRFSKRTVSVYPSTACFVAQ